MKEENNEAEGVCEKEVKRLRQEVERERMKRHRRVGGGNRSERNSFFWQCELVNKRVQIEGSELVRWREMPGGVE